MMPILVKNDDVRSGRRAKARHGRHRGQWVNRAFSEILQRGDQRKFLKKIPKRRPFLGAWKTPRRKSHYLEISMHLWCKHRRRFAAKSGFKSAQRAELAQIWQGHLNRAFSETLESGRTKGNCSKIAQKENFLIRSRTPYPLGLA